jgi:hypothetical protein
VVPPARVVRLAGQAEQRVALLGGGNAVHAQQVGDVALFEADPAEFHAADLRT